ncbi:hypothetical protein ALC60_12215 [Trachymyrmex zeteki]|uniref:Uncharacterized protein n=1 Tax=Mycetomoellerius zeteki TaxID=64791 RepID=A0A151WLL8_9HYME|nr:hypothetical protein ALC60_12215 [Trachymyrmex zeteki]
MAGYNHSNPQRVVYHATYPTPLAPTVPQECATHDIAMRNINNIERKCKRCKTVVFCQANSCSLDVIEIIYHADGDPIKLPENLETLPRAEHFPTQRHRWNTNEVRLPVAYSLDANVKFVGQ